MITQVAGLPSFLLIVGKFCLSRYEKFYSNYQISQDFKEYNNDLVAEQAKKKDGDLDFFS